MTRRAFVAAPLIGTIMFLVALVLVVSMVKTETQEVNRAVNDAYHNKLVTMLELYRSDLYVLFVDGLRQNVEDFLAGIPWINLNQVSYVEGEPKFQKQRYENCVKMKKAVLSQIISSGTYDRKCTLLGKPDAVCNTDGECVYTGENVDGVGGCVKGYRKCSCYGGQNFLNGLSDLLDAMREEFTFEGVLFRPVKFDKWDFTCNKPSDGSPTGRQLCEKLIPYSMFDCYNFAFFGTPSHTKTPFQCCSDPQNSPVKDASGDFLPQEDWWKNKKKCPSASVVFEGCNNGGFLMMVKLNDPDVYKYMPRIEAKDGVNVIRSGALGETPLDLQIRYPIYKYRHVSFEVFSRLQYFDFPDKQLKKFEKGKFVKGIKDVCVYLNGLTSKKVDDPLYGVFRLKIIFEGRNDNEIAVECGPSRDFVEKSSGVLPSDYDMRVILKGEETKKPLEELIGDEFWKGTTYKRIPTAHLYDLDPRYRVNLQGPNEYAWDLSFCYPTSGSRCE
ncbi:MAG: hypothetical protein ACE5DI_01550 [Candidatus Micrarchaeia archaeon]